MQVKKLILPSIGLAVLSVVSFAYAKSPIKLAQTGISATSVSKTESPVSKETHNILNELVSQKNYSVSSLYLKNKTINIASQIPEEYNKITQKDLTDGTKFVINDVGSSFCAFKQQSPDSYQLYKNYDYDIVFTSSDHIYLGQLKVTPSQLDCSNYQYK